MTEQSFTWMEVYDNPCPVAAGPVPIECGVYIREVPDCATNTEKEKAYVLHFCALGYYTAWQQ
jgi:hypothetical protein